MLSKKKWELIDVRIGIKCDNGIYNVLLSKYKNRKTGKIKVVETPWENKEE